MAIKDLKKYQSLTGKWDIVINCSSGFLGERHDIKNISTSGGSEFYWKCFSRRNPILKLMDNFVK